MQFRQQLTQKQTLKQALNPKLIQLFKVFNASYDQLVDQITSEQDHNMFIEITQDDQLSTSSSKGSPVADSDYNPEQFIAAKGFQSLHEFLRNQIRYLPISNVKKQVIQTLIEGLDNKGFFEDFLKTKKTILSTFNISQTIFNDCLQQLQHFEPEGVGARSLSESLLIQLEHTELENEAVIKAIKTVITHHLDDLANQNYQKIANETQLEVEGIQAVAQFIKENLTPNPGAQFTTIEEHMYIVPSFDISYDGTKLHIKNLEQEKGIQFSLSTKYIQLLKDPKTDQKTKDFLQERYDKAKELHDNLIQRRQLLQKLVTHIATKQMLYFQQGPDYLTPLLQKEVAAALNFNASSISRILCSKYVTTPYGVIPLKHLCPRRYFGKTKQQFKQFLNHYFKKFPKYSDQKIANLLAQHGIKIARRTVAKYRKDLNLESSYFDGRLTDNA